MTASHPAAALLAVEATRRRMFVPEDAAQSGGRRRAARALVSLAHRLDPQVAAMRPVLGH